MTTADQLMRDAHLIVTMDESLGELPCGLAGGDAQPAMSAPVIPHCLAR
ncbi:hypothetical protein ACWCRF_31070 [Streptomyces sp. NPDC002405]